MEPNILEVPAADIPPESMVKLVPPSTLDVHLELLPLPPHKDQ